MFKAECVQRETLWRVRLASSIAALAWATLRFRSSSVRLAASRTWLSVRFVSSWARFSASNCRLSSSTWRVRLRTCSSSLRVSSAILDLRFCGRIVVVGQKDPPSGRLGGWVTSGSISGRRASICLGIASMPSRHSLCLPAHHSLTVGGPHLGELSPREPPIVGVSVVTDPNMAARHSTNYNPVVVIPVLRLHRYHYWMAFPGLLQQLGPP